MRKFNNIVAVLGAGGHVGLPLALVLAEADFDVRGIDVNKELNALLSRGVVPYKEEGAEELLGKSLEKGNLVFTDDFSHIKDADTVIIIIGTPVDEYLNPRFDTLINLIKDKKDLFHENQLIILRSTISPGTTRLVKEILEEVTGMEEGRDFTLVFAPERVLQTRGIEEIKNIPQLLGSFNPQGFKRAESFFSMFNTRPCIEMKPVEAEIGKLITNMARYVSFALANEFYILADTFGANIHKVIEACNKDYPRLNLPKPGPNVGGPCLYKDGYYLVERMPFPEIISTSFKINESIPRYLVDKLLKRTSIRKAGILGMTFKADCDDTRNSLSFKLRKILRQNNARIIEIDPYLDESLDFGQLEGCDAVILMTPHEEFKDFRRVCSQIDNPECLIADMWNFWIENADLSHDGIYKLKDTEK